MCRVQRRIEIAPVIFFLLFFGGTLAIDQSVKFIAQTYPETAGTFFRLTENSGIAFSIPFSSTPLSLILVVILFSLSILCVQSIRHGRRNEVLRYELLLGGGISNSIDRFRFGAVQDTFALPGGLFLNLADLAILAGIFLLLWHKRSTPHPS